MTTSSVRCLLIADFTVGGLSPFLAAEAEPPSLRCRVAPFDQVARALLDGDLECWRDEPEVAVVWTRPQAAVKSFARLLSCQPVEREEILAEVDQFAGQLRAAGRRVANLFVPTWTLPAYDRGLGLLNMDVGLGPAYHLLRMNARLAESVRDDRNIRLLDAARWVALAGSGASNPKLWHLGKIAFSPEVFKHAAADIKAGVRAGRGLSRKLLVLDLDDTLWGGVVGDVGWQNLKLGGHDPVGEAFVGFQRTLRALTNRGVVLGLVSKNTEVVALEAIDLHPEMVLRRSDFAGWRINWQDKAQNLIELAAEVNLGLDSVVFIDDNPAERARIREALPQVLVPEWPADKLLYEKALAELTCFDAAALSEEDQARTRMYVSERERKALKGLAQSAEEYLASLGLRVTVDSLNPTNLPRATQLLNKTNQMNLATRRLTETQFRDWAEAEEHRTFVFRVADRFDDYGLTGLASLSHDGTTGQVIDFVMSCRVIGRGVEEVMLHTLAEHGRSLGLERLMARYAPTARNVPCKDFFAERSGFAETDGGASYEWDLRRAYPVPSHVAVQRAANDCPAAHGV
jgi:FkbH-like protein